MNNRTGSMITALLLFACVISLAFFTYQKSINPSASPKELLQNLTEKNRDEVKEAQVLYSFTFEAKDKPVFEIYGDYIAKCSSEGIMFFDKRGDVVWSEGVVYNNPMLKTNGDELIVADIGANDICVIKGRSILWKDRLDVSVLNADISEDGYVTVVTSSKRDNNEVRVYNPRGVEMFRKVIANDFAVSAHISPSEQYLAVSCIDTNSMGAYTRYKFYDMHGTELANRSFEDTGELLPIVRYGRDDNLFAAGDQAIACLDAKGDIIWEVKYNDIFGAAVIGGKQFAAVVDSDDGISLKLFSSDGSEVFTHSLKIEPEGLSEAGNRIAVYSNSNIYLYNKTGEEIGKYHSDSPIKQLMFFDRKQAAVITGNTITIIDIV